MSWRTAFIIFCWVGIVAGCITIVSFFLREAKAGAAHVEKPALTCPLAQDVQEASLTRIIYLGGVAEETTSTVEKITLYVEIDALEQLRQMMVVWRGVNCNPPQ